MNKKILILVLVADIILVAGLLLWSLEKAESSEFSKQELLQKFQTLKTQYKQAKAEGYDVTETKAFARQAKQAYNKGNYREANELLDKAFKALEKAKTSAATPTPSISPSVPISPITGQEEARERVSQVKVASLYERVTDGKLVNRSVGDVIKILKETKTDFIFRGWWIWRPCANSCSEVPPEITYPYGCEEQGYSYNHLEGAISEIKKEMPNVIFCGAIPAQRINFIEINPISGKIYDKKETREMALDPAKWGITSISKEDLQKQMQEGGSGGGAYFPDITNPNFQELFLSWAKKQIDSGADAIWIDSVWGQARIFKLITKSVYHQSVIDSFDAALRLIDEIHNYGDLVGRNIYVGTWALSSEIFPPGDFQARNLNFVTKTPTSDEILNWKIGKPFSDDRWDEIIKDSIAYSGVIPIYAFIDWADNNAPMAIFSQELSPEEQKEFLIYADKFFYEKGINFIYPIHGGYMGQSATRLSFSEEFPPGFKVYDSLTPEFQTYETIKELALKKAGEEVKVETICTDKIDNDNDSLIDNEDGDCWIREGGILDEDYGMYLTYKEYIDLLPQLKEAGIKSIELFPIWRNAGIGWMVRDYYKLDPTRGGEADLNKFIDEAHKLGIKLIVQIEVCVTPTPYKTCSDVRSGKSYYDPEGIGGAVYLYQKEHPSKKILIKDVNGNFVCFPFGFGYSIDRSSQDVIDFFSNFFVNQIIARGFDGVYIGGGTDNYYKEGERIWHGCDSWDPPQVVAEDHSPLPLFKSLNNVKRPGQIISSEHITTKGAKTKICDYPFYQPNSDLDEAMGISDDYSLMHVLRTHVLDNKLTSSELVDWINNRPISYNKLRYNAYRNSEIRGKEDYQFILNDKKYPPLVTLISTLPGVPKVTYFEFQNQMDIWKTVLPIRNNNNALKYGSIKNIWKSGDNTYAYLRKYEDEKVIVVINFLDKQATSYLDLSFLTKGAVLYDELNDEKFVVGEPENFKISVSGYGSRILVVRF